MTARSIAAKIYFVRYAACTDLEPRPGWYVATNDDCLYGPFETRREAQEVAEATPTHPEPRP
jgi:hypothetical protein